MSKTKFIGEVEARWLSDGRKMRLLKDITFIDSKNREWKAPAGSVIDGASIPRELWAMTGSPFVGKYRRASVIHDVACVERTQPHELVHYMFMKRCYVIGYRKEKRNLCMWQYAIWGRSGMKMVMICHLMMTGMMIFSSNE